MSTDKEDKFNEESHQKFLFDMYKHITREQMLEEIKKNNSDWPERDKLMLNKSDDHLTGG